MHWWLRGVHCESTLARATMLVSSNLSHKVSRGVGNVLMNLYNLKSTVSYKPNTSYHHI